MMWDKLTDGSFKLILGGALRFFSPQELWRVARDLNLWDIIEKNRHKNSAENHNAAPRFNALMGLSDLTSSAPLYTAHLAPTPSFMECLAAMVKLQLPRVVSESRTALAVTDAQKRSRLLVWGQWQSPAHGRVTKHTPEEIILPCGHIITHMAVLKQVPAEITLVATRSPQGSHIFRVDGSQLVTEFTLADGSLLCPLDHIVTSLTTGLSYILLATRERMGQIHLFVWGENRYGQLGLGHSNVVATRQEVTLPPNTSAITHLSAGNFCSFMATQDFTGNAHLWAWGNNGEGLTPPGVLGLGNNGGRVNQLTPEEVIRQTTGAPLLPPGHAITHLVTYDVHTLMATQDSTQGATGNAHLWAWGDGYSVLGLGEDLPTDRPTEITLQMDGTPLLPAGWTVTHLATSGHHSVMVAKHLLGQQHLWIWGDNMIGFLGLEDSNPRYRPQKMNVPFLPDHFIVSLALRTGCTILTTLDSRNFPHIYTWGGIPNETSWLGIGPPAADGSRPNSRDKYDLTQIHREIFNQFFNLE